MNKAEFEKKFLETIKEKMPLLPKSESALRNYFHFIDDHKIYEYKSYEELLGVVKSMRVQADASAYLSREKASGIFSYITYLMMLRPSPNPKTFIHELTHALSSTRQTTFDCSVYKKQTAPSICKSVYFKYHDYTNPSSELNENEEAAVVRWFKRNSYLFADAKTSRPVRNSYATGFIKIAAEYSEFINLRKIDKFTKTNLDSTKLFHNQIGNSYFYCRYLQNYEDEYKGLTEGTTELITSLSTTYSSIDGYVPVYRYLPEVMVCAQLYAIFGESLFEGYFKNSISPLAKKLDLDEEKFSKILKRISAIPNATSDKEYEQSMKIVNEIQVDIIKLFERKMLRELAKYKDDFQSPLDMRNAIISAFFDYSKVLHFGIFFEELVNPNFNDVWEQLDRSIKNCVEFGNKLLARRQKPLMNKINTKTLGVFKNENFYHYGYLSKNTEEITLSNRLAQFEFDYTGPDDKRRENDSKRLFGSEQVPGEIMFAINNGADQTALYLHALGEDVDEELLKTDFERESEQNNKE